MSRALGDFQFKAPGVRAEHQMVTADPEITEHQMTDDDEFLIIACDGLFLHLFFLGDSV